MTLWLRPEYARQIIDHACADVPDEACGLLFGKNGEVEAVVAAKNIEESPRSGFIVDPQELYDALMWAERERLNLVGVYHSHPLGHPIPSARDIAEAFYPDVVHLIVGLGGTSPNISAWSINDGRVSRVDLLIQKDHPRSWELESQGLTPAQRFAVIIAGLIAVALVLYVAITLLPPPELPT